MMIDTEDVEEGDGEGRTDCLSTIPIVILTAHRIVHCAQMTDRPRIPKTIFDFKEQALSNLQSDSEKDGGRKQTHLKIQLVEVNTDEIPQIKGYSEWKSLEGTGNWFICDNSSDYYILNKVNERIWSVYSLAKVESFTRTINTWINGNLMLDNCWTSPGSIQKLMNKMNWSECGVGLRYEDCTAMSNERTSVSIRAWYGNDERIGEMFHDARKDFSVSSLRMKSKGDDETRSEWYTNGRATINSSEDVDTVIYAVNKISDHYRNELEQATKWRNEEKGSFEFSFSRKVDLDRYDARVSKGTQDLKMWMISTERSSDFIRFGGVDMHTWDRILLDMGEDYAFMTIPGKGCVNAAPRLVTVQGETVTGKTKVYYNGDEIFV